MTWTMESTIYQYLVVNLGVHNPDMWDYKRTQEAEDKLNNHGNAGWDLVAIEGNKAFLKRKVVVEETMKGEDE